MVPRQERTRSAPKPRFSRPCGASAPGLYYSTVSLAQGDVQLFHAGAGGSDPTMLLDLPTGTSLVPFGAIGGLSFFADAGASYNSNTRPALWISDGTQTLTLANLGALTLESQAVPVSTFPALFASSTHLASTTIGDSIYFVGKDDASGAEPWRLDLAAGSLGRIADLTPGPASTTFAWMFPLDGGRGLGVEVRDSGVTHSNGIWFMRADGSNPRFVATDQSQSITLPVSIGSRVILALESPTAGYEPFVIELCPGDYDNSGDATVADLFAYLTDWFAASPRADFDSSGGPPSVADLFGFLNAWMAGCDW